MSSSKKIMANFSWLLLNKIVNVAVGLISGIIVIRYLGPSNNGLINYSVSFCSLFSAIATMGTSDYITKEFASKKDPSGLVAGSSFFLVSIGSIAAFFLCNLVSYYFIRDEYKQYIFILSFQFLFQPFVVFNYFFLGKSMTKYYSITQNLVHIFCFAIKVVLVLLKKPFIFFVVATLAESILLNLGFLIVYLKGSVKFELFRFDFSRVYRYFKICAPLIISSIAITIYMKFDQIMIGSMLGDRELGIYSVAVKLAEYWYFIPIIIYNSFLPILAELFAKDKEKYLHELQFFADILGGISITAATCIACFSGLIVTILYGAEFSSAAPVLAIYCWAGVFVSVSYTKVVHCTNCNMTKFQMYSTGVGAIINIGLNALLIPSIGACGAALATVIAQFSSSVVACAMYKPLRKLAIVQAMAFFPYIRLYRRGKNEIVEIFKLRRKK